MTTGRINQVAFLNDDVRRMSQACPFRHGRVLGERGGHSQEAFIFGREKPVKDPCPLLYRIKEFEAPLTDQAIARRSEGSSGTQERLLGSPRASSLSASVWVHLVHGMRGAKDDRLHVHNF